MIPEMKIKHLSLTVIIVLSLVGIMLTGCVEPSVRHMWKGYSRPGHIHCEYETFTGTEDRSVQAEAGQTITLEYGATVNKGSLSIKVQDPDKESI